MTAHFFILMKATMLLGLWNWPIRHVRFLRLIRRYPPGTRYLTYKRCIECLEKSSQFIICAKLETITGDETVNVDVVAAVTVSVTELLMALPAELLTIT